MLKLFSKGGLKVVLTLLSISGMNSSLQAWDSCDPCECHKMYVGVFGGGLYSNSTRLSQMGTAFFTEAEGGPLAVYAKGHAKSSSAGFGGFQIGSEWSPSPLSACSDWMLTPAAEVEAYFYSHHLKGHLINDTLRLPEHDFLDSFHRNHSVLLVNAVFSLDHCSLGGFSPYVGGGIGATRISLKSGDSLQVAPVEDGVNHFNSRRSDSSWAFAAQAKFGVRYKISEAFQVFGEYRYLYVDSSNYILGSTVYPTHAPTSPWNVKVNSTNYNAFAFGIRYAL